MTNFCCSRDLLESSLSFELSELQEAELAEHLSECVECQHLLEQLAADQQQWSRVEGVLKQESRTSLRAPDTADKSSDSTRMYMSSSLRPDDQQPLAENAADFAVEFLEPCEAPDTLGRLGDIEIQCVIGRGGMGIVLKGFQPELSRPVAVKVLAPHFASNGAARQRFAREARATAVIVHPNVMPILTVDASGRLPYLVMPYVPCESLQQRLDRDGALEATDVVRIGMQVAHGLAAAHAQGLVHRDVKPANILLEHGVDRVMLTDFGLARAVDDASLTRSGVIAGTPQYMSPEQAQGEPIDVRSDLFSLGSVMYAMATGRPPFRAETSYGILHRIVARDPRPIPEINEVIPDWLCRIIARLLTKQAADRFDSAAIVAEMLEQCLAYLKQPSQRSLPVRVHRLPEAWGNHDHSSWRTRLRNWLRRNPVASGLGVTCIGLCGLLMFQLSERSPDQKQSTEANTPAAIPTDSNDQTTAAPTDNRTESVAASAASAWTDSTDEQLESLWTDFAELEFRTSQFWHEPQQPVTQPPETSH